MRATPSTGSTRNTLQFPSIVNVLDAIAKVAFGPARVRRNDEVSAVNLCLFAPDEIAIHVGGHHQAVGLVHAGAGDESLPDLLSTLR